MTNFLISTSCVCVWAWCRRHILQCFVMCSGSTSFTVDQPDKEINSSAFWRFVLLVNRIFLFTDCAKALGLFLLVVDEPRLSTKLSGRLAASSRPSRQMFLIHKWQQFMSTKCRAAASCSQRGPRSNEVSDIFPHYSVRSLARVNRIWQEFLFSRWVGVSLAKGNQSWELMNVWVATKESNISPLCSTELPKGDAEH